MFIFIDEHTSETPTEKRAVALIGNVWFAEECNGDWKPFPESEYVIYEDCSHRKQLKE